MPRKPKGSGGRGRRTFTAFRSGLTFVLTYTGYPGYVVVTSVHRGYSAFGEEVYRRPEDRPMPKPIGNTNAEELKTAPRKKSAILGKLAEIASYLADTKYPDGSPVGSVQLSLRTRGPSIVAQLKLATLGGLRLQVEEANVDDALIALEAALNAQPVPWEPDPYPLDGTGKKKK